MLIDNAGLQGTELAGKVAVVTGAGQGIGKETARLLGRLGAAVAIAEINDSGAETEAQIRSEGGRALFIMTDVADEASMAHLCEQVRAMLGPVDILINNAEYSLAKSVLDHSLAEWDRVVNVDLRAVFLGIKIFLPDMLSKGEGVIITMPSAEGMPYLGPYLAAKVAARSLTMSLAQELGEESGVAVYCFGVGMVETPGGMAAFRQLAPLYGLSLDEFIKQSGGQIISAELCATGLIGTILYAREFHGQMAGHGSGLAKLGLDASGERCEPSAAWPESDGPTAVPSPVAADSLQAEALARNRRVEEVVQAMAKEYAELTLFQRPIVKRMFQQGTGLKIEEWQGNARAMTVELEHLASEDGALAEPLAPSRVTAYIDQLRRLADYNRKLEPQAQGYFKGEKLVAALAALRERRQAAEDLVETLTEIQRSGT